MDLKTSLNRFCSKLQFSNSEKSDALEAWREPIKNILDEVKRNDERFSVSKIHYTGSFYERAKTERPDEFDLMLELSNITVSTSRKVVATGFTFVIADESCREKWKKDNIVDGQGRLNAIAMRAVFSRLVNDAIRKNDSNKTIKCTTHGPAVTLRNIKTVEGKSLDVDLTLSIKLSSWPSVTTYWKQRERKGWPSEELLQEMETAGSYVVMKQPADDRCGQERDFFWRYSFSLAEKAVMTKMDKGVSNSCRRKILQMLKFIISNDLQLKTVPLTSYHMKTLIFWESERYPKLEDWDSSQIAERFCKAVSRLLTFVQKKSFPHYFMANFNLFGEFIDPHFATMLEKFGNIKTDPVKYVSQLM